MKLLESNDITLVVGDVHAGPNHNVNRGTILGRCIADVRPKRVVFIGDLGSFDSLSAWDKDKRKLMEGRRYQKDVDSIKKFIGLVETGAGRYMPEVILTAGNHEDRLRRYLEYHPVFSDTVDMVKDLGIEHWTTVPYMEYFNHKGVGFTHVPINEAGRPVSGDSACKRSLGLCHTNVVFGHTHKLASCAIHRHGSPHLTQAINVGCFFDHTDEYAVGSSHAYWRGLVVIDHYDRSAFNWMPIRMGKLKELYGQ
jgi:hypothetical protein